MHTAQRVLAVTTGLLGILLIARSLADGKVLPISVQFIVGIVLIAVAWLRWRSL